MRANIKNARGTLYVNGEPIAEARCIELQPELQPEAIEKQFPSNISKYSSIDLGPCEITEISPEFGRRVIGEADVTARRKVKPRDVVLGIVAVVLLLILAALVTNRAFAVNEPPELIIPQAPPHAASGLLIAPVPPETSADTPNTYPSQEDALNTAMEAIPDELVAEAALLAWGEYSGSDYAQRTAPIWCACNRADAWGLTLDEVMHSDAFHGLLTEREVPEEWYDLARETLARWELEKMGYIDVGRTLPSEYLYFSGNGVVNVYRTEYIGGVEYVPGDGI
jgi:hypothetical protein